MQNASDSMSKVWESIELLDDLQPESVQIEKPPGTINTGSTIKCSIWVPPKCFNQNYFPFSLSVYYQDKNEGEEEIAVDITTNHSKYIICIVAEREGTLTLNLFGKKCSEKVLIKINPLIEKYDHLQIKLSTKQLGSGSSGVVMEGHHLQIPVAIKMLKPEHTTQQQKQFEKEGNILFDFNHSNILKCFGHDRNWIITERCSDTLHGQIPNLVHNPCARRNLAIQITCGVQYIHSRGFILKLLILDYYNHLVGVKC